MKRFFAIYQIDKMRPVFLRIVISITFCLFFFQTVLAQTDRREVDSLTNELNKLENDTLRAQTQIRLSHLYWYFSLDTALLYAQEAYNLVDGNDAPAYQIMKAHTLNSMGVSLMRQYEEIKALEKFFECIEIYTKYNKVVNIAYARGNLAIIHSTQKEYQAAAEEFVKVRQILENEPKSRQIEINLAMVDSNLGDCYLNLDELEKALSSVLRSAENNDLPDKDLLGVLKSQAGLVLTVMGRFDEAKKYLEEGVALVEGQGDHVSIADVYENYAILEDSLGNSDNVIAYSTKGYEYSEKAGYSDSKDIFSELLAKNYAIKGDYTKAYQYLHTVLDFRDSVFNEDKKRELHRLEMKQKDAEIALERQEKKLQTAANERKNYVIISIIGALLSVIVLAFMFFKGRQKEKKSNTLLQEQKKEILQQNEELQQQSEEISTQRDFIEANNKVLNERNEQVTQSIEAAKLIQQAMLPFHDRIKGYLQNYFVVYKPKDIVSGDFYWVNKVDDVVIVAVVDCTGHGVPGAFMSMIGNLLLENIVMVNKETDPQTILNQLNDQTIKALQQENSQDLNGMDISLVSLRELENGEIFLSFSGAKRPLYYYDDVHKEMKVVKGTNKAIGGRQFDKQFEKNEITLKKDTLIYLGSDGFEDQHNENNKKIGRKRLLKELDAVHNLPMNKQKEHLESFLQHHMEGVHQRDDILLIGVKL